MENAIERREQIIERLRLYRQDNVYKLANDFGVSRQTIWRDLIILSVSYPITTKPGPCGGIIWSGNRPASAYTEREIKAIQNAIMLVSPEDAMVLEKLIKKHSVQAPFNIKDIFICIENGLTQTQLADKLGIRKGTLSNIMAGRRAPSADLAKRILELKEDILKNNEDG